MSVQRGWVFTTQISSYKDKDFNKKQHYVVLTVLICIVPKNAQLQQCGNQNILVPCLPLTPICDLKWSLNRPLDSSIFGAALPEIQVVCVE